MIEILVIIVVIGILVGLLVPAVQSAREAARRAQCVNNLRQIGLSLHAYNLSNSSFPIGRCLTRDPDYTDPSHPCNSWVTDKSYLVSILPFIDKSIIYNNVNMQKWIFGSENLTIRSLSFPVFSCPSDPISGSPRMGVSDLSSASRPSPMVATNYAGCHGSFVTTVLPLPQFNCNVSPADATYANGSITDVGPITVASIIDGMNNTIFVSEKTSTPLRGLDDFWPGKLYFERSGWWFSGNWSDTLTTNYYPPNSFKRISGAVPHAWSWSASSFHPNGVNVLMGDGSVRYVKENIDSQSLDSQTGILFTPPASVPVWQALATRNGSDISTD